MKMAEADFDVPFPTSHTAVPEFGSNSSDDYDDIDYEYEDYAAFRRSMDIFSIVVYSITFLLGVSGNSVVILITGFKMKKTMHTIWLLNLAIANLIFTFFLPLEIIYTALYYHWAFGKFLCQLDGMVTFLNMFASVFFLTVITFDNFLTVVHPVWSKNYRTVKLAMIMVLITWIVSVILCSPDFAFRDTYLLNNSHVACFDNFLVDEEYYEQEEPQPLSKVREYAMAVTRCLFGFVIPFIIIIICYTISALMFQRSLFAKSNKPFKITTAMIIAFFICWLPYHIFAFLTMALTSSSDYNMQAEKTMTAGNSLALCLAFFNSCINPILYFFMGQDFRG